jgi:hypothetical protein
LDIKCLGDCCDPLNESFNFYYPPGYDYTSKCLLVLLLVYILLLVYKLFLFDKLLLFDILLL